MLKGNFPQYDIKLHNQKKGWKGPPWYYGKAIGLGLKDITEGREGLSIIQSGV